MLRAVKQTGWRKRVLASTRGQILQLLRTKEQTVNDLAAALQLTDNAVRAHLLSLERDRLIHQSGTQPGVRKPHATYALTADAEQVFPKAYGPLVDLILTVFERKMTPAELEAGMREFVRKVADEDLEEVQGKTRQQLINAALRILSDLGGAARFEKSEGKHFIRGHGCPLAAATGNHPEACLIAESLLSQVIGATVKECCVRQPQPSCCFEIS